MKLLTSLLFSVVVSSTVAFANEPLFDIRVDKPAASPGEFVLCPSRQFYDSAVEKGVDRTTFIYYAAKMIEAGDKESTVRSLAGTQYSLPNEFIVSLPSNQTAEVGDIVLTWWQSGSGMQRAIVVGGTKEKPIVRYLDITYENPSGAGRKDDQLAPGTFYVLSEPWQIGTSVAVRVGSQRRVGQLVAMDQKSVLVREFAGKLKRYERKDAEPIAIRPKLADEAPSAVAAQAALFGSLKPITLIKVDEKIGRVFATYQLGRTEKEKAFPFGEVVLSTSE